MNEPNYFFKTPAYFIPNSEEPILFLPLLCKALYINNSEKGVIEKLKSEGINLQELRQSSLFGFLTENNLLIDSKPVFKFNTNITQYKPTDAVLLLTDSCNLGCTYCFADSIPSKKKLNIEVALRAIDLILDNAKAVGSVTPTIRFLGGGEPTMEWKNLVVITEYAKQKAKDLNLKVWIRLVTNGTLLNDDRLLWIARYIDFITLSFEVLPDLQEQRPFINGTSSHAKVLELVKKLSGYGIKSHIRTTISDKTAHKLSEMVEYLKEYNVTHIRFEPLSQIGRSIETNTNRPLAEVFVKEFLEARELGKKYSMDVTSKQFLDISNPRARFCSFEFSVGSNETVTACHRFSREEHDSFDFFKFGYYKDGQFTFDVEKLNEILALNGDSYTDCQSCFAKWNCAGGCLSARIKNNVPSKHGPLCDLTRDLLKASIIENLDSVSSPA